MMKLMILAGVIALSICLMGRQANADNLLVNPESVVYDSTQDRYLVGNCGNGAIVQIDKDGNQSYFNADLMPYYSVLGLHIRDGSLYAAANGVYMGVKVFDLATGALTGSIDIPGAYFLNDVTSDSSGFVYTTDSDAFRIYKLRLSDYNVSIFVNTGASSPNGILFDPPHNRLLVSLHSASEDILAAVDLDDSSMTQAVDAGVPVDGITEDDERNIYISAWSTNTVYRFDSDFSSPKTVVASGFTSPADIFFNKKHSILAVPNFNANRLDLIALDVGLFTRWFDIDPVADGATHGIGWPDINGDNYPDLYLANNLSPDGQANRLFQNNDGTGFTTITAGDIANDLGLSLTSTWGDCDNDGDLDVFVANGPDQANRLYLNNGDGTFAPMTEGDIVAEVDDSRASSWVDYDNDGKLDLFVANVGFNSLFRNTGVSFTKITDAAIATASNDANGACWGDYNNDGYADLFVALPDNQNNRLYTNNGDGTFSPVSGGIIVNDGGNSCGGSWGDYDNDGDLDLFVPNMSDQDNLLYNNQGDGTFIKITSGEIVNDGGCSYGSAWGDYDNDGDLDLFVSNTTEGVSSGQDFLYQNNGDGTFTKVTQCEIVDAIEDSYGTAWADYDRDGDLDLFVARTAGTGEADNGFYRNNRNSSNWISIKCIGGSSNGAAIGAKVRIKAIIGGQPIWQMREISAQTGFGGQNALDIHFGLGDAAIIDSLIIEWPNGASQTLSNIAINQFMEVTDFMCGDTNGDKQVNVGDAVFLINYVFKGGAGPDPECAGDANGDGNTNVGDAVYLISHVFKGGPGPVEDCC